MDIKLENVRYAAPKKSRSECLHFILRQVLSDTVYFGCCTRLREFQTVLDDISLTLPSGCMVLVTGPGRCGKTTLLRLLAKQLRPTSGVLQAIPKRNVQATASIILQTTDQSLASHSYMNTLTVDEVMLMTQELSDIRDYGTGSNQLLVDRRLAFAGMTHLRHMAVGTLSRTERLLLHLAQLLTASPSVILLDDVLDNMSSDDLRRYLFLLSKLATNGVTVIVSSHRTDLCLSEYFNNLVLLASGHIVYAGACTAFPAYLQLSLGLSTPVRATNLLDYVIQKLGVAARQFGDSAMTALTPAAAPSAHPNGPNGGALSKQHKKDKRTGGVTRDTETSEDDEVPLMPLTESSSDTKNKDIKDNKDTKDSNMAQLRQSQQLQQLQQSDQEEIVRWAIRNLRLHWREHMVAHALLSLEHPSMTLQARAGLHGQGQTTGAPGTSGAPGTQNARGPPVGNQGGPGMPLHMGLESGVLQREPPTMLSACVKPLQSMRLLLWRGTVIFTRPPYWMLWSVVMLLSLALLLRTLLPDSAEHEKTRATLTETNFLFFIVCIGNVVPHTMCAYWVQLKECYVDERRNLCLYPSWVFGIADTLHSVLVTLVWTIPFLLLAANLLDERHETGVFYGLLFFHLLIASSIVETAAFITGEQRAAHCYAAAIQLVNLVFSGFVVPVHQIPSGLRWLSSFSYSELTYSGLLQLSFQNDPTADLVHQFLQPTQRAIEISFTLLTSLWLLVRTFFAIAVHFSS